MIQKFLNFSLLLFFSACVTVPGSNKSAVILVSESEEKKMGTRAYAEILAKERISRDSRLNAILQRVGQRVAAQAPVKYDWQFTLIDSKDMNAFCLPGGKVAFYTGIVPSLQNEAGMAIVMGHEIAHAVARHGAQRMSQAMMMQGGLILTSAALGLGKKGESGNIIMAALGLGAQVGVMLPFSRNHESEADTIGLEYAAGAGYDPEEGFRFWERFSKATGGGGTPGFLSTHPSPSSRIKELQKMAAKVQDIYQGSPKYGLGETL